MPCITCGVEADATEGASTMRGPNGAHAYEVLEASCAGTRALERDSDRDIRSCPKPYLGIAPRQKVVPR